MESGNRVLTMVLTTSQGGSVRGWGGAHCLRPLQRLAPADSGGLYLFLFGDTSASALPAFFFRNCKRCLNRESLASGAWERRREG